MALFSWSAVSAQQVPQRRPLGVVPQAAAAAEPSSRPADGDSTEVIEVLMNRAKIITLPRPVDNIVLGDPAVANVTFDDRQPTKMFISPTAIGSTNVFFIDERGEIIRQAVIRVILNHDGIQAALARLLPGQTIDVAVFRGTVFLTGKVHTAADAALAQSIARQFVAEDANVNNRLKLIGAQQVILQVRVAEMARDVRKNLSASGFFSKQLNPRALIGGRGLQFFTTGVTPTLTAFAAGTLFTGSNVFGNPAFSVLERQNLVKTLAEPTLTALSGETATFLSGGEFPFPSGLDENGNTVFEFREFGIALEFTPVVIDEGRINLQISTEISSLGNVVNGQQSLVQKRTETTIELPSGGTIMISGLLQEDMQDSISGFPYLKDIPVLGALFRSSEFQQQKTELVIIVTVYLAKTVDFTANLALPTDGFEPASDIDIYLLGRLRRRYSKEDRSYWSDPIKGPFGYIMK